MYLKSSCIERFGPAVDAILGLIEEKTEDKSESIITGTLLYARCGSACDA